MMFLFVNYITFSFLQKTLSLSLGGLLCQSLVSLLSHRQAETSATGQRDVGHVTLADDENVGRSVLLKWKIERIDH